MKIDPHDLWAAKAHALDRYRWRLLRERHSLLGAALRWLREAIIDWGFGVLVLGRMARPASPEPCDFLLLQAAPKVIGLQRKKLLKAGLLARGFQLQETALAERMDQLRHRYLAWPTQTVPLRYLGYAAHAQWLVTHYRPKILLNDRNGSLYSPFLRVALHEHHGLLVHLAHATTLESSRRLSMNDYDYYFLFGRSSLEALQQRPLRFGDSQAVLAGSHMIDQGFDLTPAEASWNTLLVLGVGPDKEKESGYQQTYALIRDWAAQHPEMRVLIKSHPRSTQAFWIEAAHHLKNVEVLPLDYPLPEALAQSSGVINIMSNAVIEAALARRPILYVNLSHHRDIFRQEAFFGPCITSVAELQYRLEHLNQAYAQALQQSAAFAEYHLAQGYQGLNHVLNLLEQLQQGQPCDSLPLNAAGLH